MDRLVWRLEILLPHRKSRTSRLRETANLPFVKQVIYDNESLKWLSMGSCSKHCGTLPAQDIGFNVTITTGRTSVYNYPTPTNRPLALLFVLYSWIEVLYILIVKAQKADNSWRPILGLQRRKHIFNFPFHRVWDYNVKPIVCDRFFYESIRAKI